jgi:hypothetical protein
MRPKTNAFRGVEFGIAVATLIGEVMSNGFSHSTTVVSKAKKSTVDVWLLLSIPIAILVIVAAGEGVFVRGLYRDTPFFAIQAFAQDFITLFVVLPALVVSAWFAARRSDRGRLVWLGAIAYLVYSYVIDAFVVRFNSMFLVYVALLGCALYALIGGFVTTDMNVIKARFARRTPVRSVSVCLGVLALTFYTLWLREAIPAVLTGTVPLSVEQNGTPTNAVQVLDMAWMLPAFVIAAVSLARKTALGYTLAGAALTFVVLLSLAVLSIVAFMIARDYPVIIPQVALFGAVLVLALGLLSWYLTALRPAAEPNVAVVSTPMTAAAG